jgi:hypothetical protein
LTSWLFGTAKVISQRKLHAVSHLKPSWTDWNGWRGYKMSWLFVASHVSFYCILFLLRFIDKPLAVTDFSMAKVDASFLLMTLHHWNLATSTERCIFYECLCVYLQSNLFKLRNIPIRPKKIVAQWNLVARWHGNPDFCMTRAINAMFFAWHAFLRGSFGVTPWS